MILTHQYFTLVKRQIIKQSYNMSYTKVLGTLVSHIKILNNGSLFSKIIPLIIITHTQIIEYIKLVTTWLKDTCHTGNKLLTTND